MKHTPAPWFPVEYAGLYRIQSEEGYCESDLQDVETNPNVEADVKLMAAAPELLEACMNLENDDNSIPEHAWNLIQSAIKKAIE
jgi:hypothetical protein